MNVFEAIKTYTQNMGATRFIGKKYAGGGDAWGEWKEQNLFESVKTKVGAMAQHDDGDALIGLMCHRNGFEYWLGYFTPAGTTVPEGLDYEDFPAMPIAVCWFYEKDEDSHDLAVEALANIEHAGHVVTTDWWFERYAPTRCKDFFIAEMPNDTIMDVGYFIEGKKDE